VTAVYQELASTRHHPTPKILIVSPLSPHNFSRTDASAFTTPLLRTRLGTSYSYSVFTPRSLCVHQRQRRFSRLSYSVSYLYIVNIMRVMIITNTAVLRSAMCLCTSNQSRNRLDRSYPFLNFHFLACEYCAFSQIVIFTQKGLELHSKSHFIAFNT
jgi:hypothetical protein